MDEFDEGTLPGGGDGEPSWEWRKGWVGRKGHVSVTDGGEQCFTKGGVSWNGSPHSGEMVEARPCKSGKAGIYQNTEIHLL